MGHFSFLRFVPASIANTPIHWTRVPEGSKKSLGHWKHIYESPLDQMKSQNKSFTPNSNKMYLFSSATGTMNAF